MYARGFDFSSFSMICLLDFGTVSEEYIWYFISYLSFDHCIFTCACFHERIKSQHHSFALIDITQQAPCMEQKWNNVAYCCLIRSGAASQKYCLY